MRPSPSPEPSHRPIASEERALVVRLLLRHQGGVMVAGGGGHPVDGVGLHVGPPDAPPPPTPPLDPPSGQEPTPSCPRCGNPTVPR